MQNEIAYCEDKAEKVESFKENQTFFNEEDYYERQENCYLKIKDKLNNLLNSHQEFNELNSVFDESKFVKIQYDDTRFYIVGAIYEKGDIKYVCYGVKGEYNSMPKELDGYCRFVPKNCFDLYGDGYYLIFQDAKNGKIIT